MATEALSVWFPRARGVELRREPLPAVGAGEVRVRALASGVSHGTEMLVYRGQVEKDMTLDLPTLAGSFGFPVKYGYASVGRVTETKPESRLEEGDAVFALHPHQSEYVVPESLCVALPPDLPAEHGIFFANVETALNVLLDAHPRLGDRVLVSGQGVVGLLITQLARRAGARTVLTVDPIAARRDLSRRLGADAALTPDELAEAVGEQTAGDGVDLAIEASGNPAALPPLLDLVTRDGTIVVCSWYGTKPVSLPLGGTFHRGRLRIVSSQVGSLPPGLTWTRERRTQTALDLLQKLDLAPLITHRFPLGAAAEAYDLIDRHPDHIVQGVFTYGEADV